MINRQVARPRLSRKKRLVFGTITLLIVIASTEVIAWLGLSMVRSGESFEQIHLLQQQLANTGTTSDTGTETIHPYLGWVMNPQVNRGTELGGRTIPVNALGFCDEEAEIPKRSPERLIVGVLGGSVAWQMTVLGESAFREALRENPLWRDKQIHVVRLAMSGYKQPQQLMALNYLLALGAEFDVIVNIDGYNEMALAVCESIERGVFAAYPRMWHVRTHDIVDPRIYEKSFRVFEIRATRQRLARNICNSWFRWSATVNVVWKLRDVYCENCLIDVAEELQKRRQAEGHGFASDGPRQSFKDEAAMFEHLRDIWKASSMQIHHLCAGNGTKYVHILQPNQYFPGSKPMFGDELKEMFDKNQCYGHSIAKGYPLLIRDGRQLQEQGVRFHDLTMLFADIEEPIYVDRFCHYNERGNDLLARTVAGKIIDAFRAVE